MSSIFPGRIRPSQLITTFGPGSIMDLPNDSVMIIGLDFWPSSPTRYKKVLEPRLQAFLRINEFRVPISLGDEGHIPGITFPKMRVCADCNSLSEHPFVTFKQKFVCRKCGSERTYPARLIMACRQGHIDDFPWSDWVHRGKPCSNSDLAIITMKKSAALSDLLVVCHNCNSKRSLAKALSTDGVSSVTKCSGFRPWLQDKIDDCREDPRGLQRGASNVYFSVTESSLSIPPWSTPLYSELELYWPAILKLLKTNPASAKIVISQLLSNYEPNDVQIAIDSRQSLQNSRVDLRGEEWLVLRTTKPIRERDFEVIPEEVPDSIKEWIETLSRVQRLKEIRVLRGFTRIDPPDPELPGSVPIIPLSRSRLDWLPAVEVFGEGIFFALNEKKLHEWEKRASVITRAASIIEVYREWRESQGWPQTNLPLPRFILLHTIAHAMIRQLALDSGYPSASIRERIYSSDNMHGILLYTAADDSEGSLGGLVQLGKQSSFEDVFRNTLTSSLQCSSDPLCIENEPKVTRTFNGAACHVCLFASETSCERSNRLLDRQMIIPLKDQSISMFFNFFEA